MMELYRIVEQDNPVVQTVSSVHSIERAFALLDALRPGPAGVTELSRRVDLPKSTVARLLSTLQGVGAVERDDDGVRYRRSAEWGRLPGQIGGVETLVAVARPGLAALVDQLGESAGLSVPDGYLARYISQVDSGNPVQVRDWTGERIPMHAVSSGLVFLADLPDKALDDFLRHPLAGFTPHTVTSPSRLRRRLREVRTDGYAWVEEEYAEGINSVAAPVRRGDGRTIAALHVHGPSYRFPGRSAGRSAAEVVAAAETLSAQLG
jgi:IclR family acetate operon transcriptional repressor